MFAIDTGDCDIMFGVEWLCTLGLITMDLRKLTIKIQQDGHRYQFQGITSNSLEIINSHQMEKLLKKGHSNIISQLHSIQVVKNLSSTIHPNLQCFLSQHQYIFNNPQGLPPSHGAHDHSIRLVPSSPPPNVFPYRHPFDQKNEIEKIVRELLTTCVIRPSTSPYFSPTVVVLKK
jgi:hypothetical protein